MDKTMDDVTTLERTLEAVLMVADEPQSLVSLATALGAPVPAVRQSIERLVADFDGAGGGVRRGFELREVGGRGRGEGLLGLGGLDDLD